MQREQRLGLCAGGGRQFEDERHVLALAGHVQEVDGAALGGELQVARDGFDADAVLRGLGLVDHEPRPWLRVLDVPVDVHDAVGLGHDRLHLAGEGEPAFLVGAVHLGDDRLQHRWARGHLSHGRNHPVSARDGSALRPWVEQRLREAGVDGGDGPIRLLCFPRLLGYVFNPLSVYFCHRADGSLAAAVYEVKNTFGEQHTYVLPATGEDACDKAFYVSPFIDMKARYRFRLHAPDGTVWAWHDPSDDNLVEGPAEAFCQVVTQTRNVADTDLRVRGETARLWMSLAQCFAGVQVFCNQVTRLPNGNLDAIITGAANQASKPEEYN